MPRPDVPHFDLPFRFRPGGAVVVEQDSSDDVFNCAQAVIRYPLGYRDDLPEYGTDHQQFREGPLDLEAIATGVIAWDARAEDAIEEDVDNFNAGLRVVALQVFGGGAGEDDL